MAWYMLFYHSPVTGSQLFLTGSQLIFPGSEPCSTLPKCIQVNMISLMSAKMKKNIKKWTKSLIFCLFPPSLLPTAAFTAKAKPSEAKPKTKIIIVFQNKKKMNIWGYLWQEWPTERSVRPNCSAKLLLFGSAHSDRPNARFGRTVTRMYEPKVNEFLFRMKKVKRRKKMLLKKYDDDWSRYDNDLCGIYSNSLFFIIATNIIPLY